MAATKKAGGGGEKAPGFAERFKEAFSKTMTKEHADEYDAEDDPMAGVVPAVDDDAMFEPIPKKS